MEANKTMRIIALFIITIISCKSANFRPTSPGDDSPQVGNPSSTQPNTEQFVSEEPIKQKLTIEQATGWYFVKDHANADELERLHTEEFGSDESQMALTAKVLTVTPSGRKVIRYTGTKNVRQDVAKWPKPKYRKPMLAWKPQQTPRFGTLPPRVSPANSPISIGTLTTSGGKQIPVRMIKSVDDIPIGTGEHGYLSLTRAQYDLLSARVADSPALRRTRLSVVKENENAVTVKITDITLDTVDDQLARGTPLMFASQNTAYAKTWEAVREDLSMPLEVIEDDISRGISLGEGSFGEATLITKTDGTQYVIKTMDADDDINLREIAILTDGSCEDCLQYFGAVQRGDTYYLASEYASGGTLRDYTEKYLLTNTQIIELLRQGKQLAENSLINSDIKLSNILVTESGNVKIMDYGLSRRNPSLIPGEGTRTTMAPEVAQSKIIEAGLEDRIHTYSLGVSILQGKSPRTFAENEKAIIENNLYAYESNIKFVEVPPFTAGERDLMAKMLEVDPRKRISMSEALDRWTALQ